MTKRLHVAVTTEDKPEIPRAIAAAERAMKDDAESITFESTSDVVGPRETYKSALRRSIKESDGLLLIWSARAASSATVAYEAGLAAAFQKPVAVVQTDPNAPALPTEFLGSRVLKLSPANDAGDSSTRSDERSQRSGGNERQDSAKYVEPIARSTITFGLVEIPVLLYPSMDDSQDIQFELVNRRTGSRVKQGYIDHVTGEIVEPQDLVMAYEYQADRFVYLTEEELEAVGSEVSDAIEVEEFIALEKVDPIFFAGSYYLGPDKGGPLPYRLLAKAMQQLDMAAIGRYVNQGEGQLVLIRSFEDGLIMQQLLYAGEIRPFSQVIQGDAEPTDEEVALGLQLLAQTTSRDFHPENYSDQMRERMLQILKQKSVGQELTFSQPEAPQAEVIDFIEALRQSIEKGSASSGGVRRQHRGTAD